MNKANGTDDGPGFGPDDQDLVVKGFHRLEDKLVDRKAPKLKFGSKWAKLTDREKLNYITPLAASMNHAAYLIQGERDQLNTLLEQKEEQLKKMGAAMEQNHMMLQQGVANLNEQRQHYHANVQELNGRIRELEQQVKALEAQLDGDIS